MSFSVNNSCKSVSIINMTVSLKFANMSLMSSFCAFRSMNLQSEFRLVTSNTKKGSPCFAIGKLNFGWEIESSFIPKSVYVPYTSWTRCIFAETTRKVMFRSRLQAFRIHKCRRFQEFCLASSNFQRSA